MGEALLFVGPWRLSEELKAKNSNRLNIRAVNIDIGRFVNRCIHYPKSDGTFALSLCLANGKVGNSPKVPVSREPAPGRMEWSVPVAGCRRAGAGFGASAHAPSAARPANPAPTPHWRQRQRHGQPRCQLRRGLGWIQLGRQGPGCLA